MAEMTWDDAYKAYRNQLLSGDVNADFIRSTYEPLSKDFADRIIAIHKDLANQQKATLQGGKTLGDQWYGGDIGKEDATWDMAFRLAETGVGSLYDIGQRQVEREETDGEGGVRTYVDQELFNKRTGDALTNFNRESGTFDTTYNLQFTPDGMPIAYTGNKQSDWVQFRDEALRPALQFAGSFIPVVGPYVAAANSIYAASKGDWGKAILSALPAVGRIAGQFGVAADTVSMVNEANKYAKILKSLEDKNLLSAAFQGADLAGITELGGFDLNDVKKAVNLGMAIKNEDPMALVRAGMAYVPKAGFGRLGFYVDDFSSDVEPFAVQSGDTFGGGYVDMNVPDQGEAALSEFLVRPSPIEIPEIVSGRDEGVVEIVGKKFPEERAKFPDLPGFELNPEDLDLSQYLVQPTPIEIPEIMPGLEITAPRLPPEPEFPEMVVTAPRPSYPQIELTPEDLAPPEIIPTPIDIPPVVGPTPAPAPKPPAAPAPKPPAAPAPAPFDLSGLLLLLGGQQQGPIPLTVPENSADIELMEDIFGPSLSAPSTGTETDKAEALARLLRS